MNYQTIQVRFQEQVCFIQFCRPESNNTINNLMIKEMSNVLSRCESSASIVVLEGLPDVFCFGADFKEIHECLSKGQTFEQDPELLYDLWLKLASGSFVTISHVKGKVNAGGVGFVAASDIVIAGQSAQFSLSELLFGLFPACVMPFLIRRMGFQKANYMTLMTQPISVQQAQNWGLVDVTDAQSEALLRKHLLRLRYLSKKSISEYKLYMNKLNDLLLQSKPLAIDANKKLFSDQGNLYAIYKFVETERLPWQE